MLQYNTVCIWYGFHYMCCGFYTLLFIFLLKLAVSQLQCAMDELPQFGVLELYAAVFTNFTYDWKFLIINDYSPIIILELFQVWYQMACYIKYVNMNVDYSDYASDLSACICDRLSRRRRRWYLQNSNISRTLVGNTIVDHSDVAGTSSVGATAAVSSISA